MIRRRGRLRRREPGGLRLSEREPAELRATPEHRISDTGREEAAEALGRAQRDGRFGASDLYERRMASLHGAARQRDLDDLLGDLDDLVPGRVREGMLRAVARAHAEGRLDFAEFSARSDRCLGPLSRAEAEALVRDLGYRIALPMPQRGALAAWAGPLRRVTTVAAVGGIVGAGLVALPAGLELPGEISMWLPLVFVTGAFTAVASAIATVAWMVRRPVRRWPSRAGTLDGRGDDLSGNGDDRRECSAGPARARHVPAVRLGGDDR